jgi:hypothetical protein
MDHSYISALLAKNITSIIPFETALRECLCRLSPHKTELRKMSQAGSVVLYATVAVSKMSGLILSNAVIEEFSAIGCSFELDIIVEPKSSED